VAIDVGVVVRNGLTTSLLDGLDGDIGSLAALVLDGRAEVVDDDLGASLGEGICVCAANTVTSTGDDCDTTLQADLLVSEAQAG